ncbi:hypothetical protein EV644_101881 [Kribbella orskensis]|uniref:Uncharacterized protein n=1 Tax=Kribbella orskensis TaxID=2512216 RepID=A0ABY2C003_9ACTN|nr:MULTISPECIES: hypothetical protein [Kribbella]TCN43984.1 hypothetical protein EV642_101108 [Kribbella sp. VKM Ac-2500]TCO32238.1 hypothetical protein EV644_101881 [Kribbella orskensis]
MAVDTNVVYIGVYDEVADAGTDYDLVKEPHPQAGLPEFHIMLLRATGAPAAQGGRNRWWSKGPEMMTRRAGSDRGTLLPLVMRAVGLAVLALLFTACGDNGSAVRPTTSASRVPSSLPSPTAELSPTTRSPLRTEAPSPTRTAPEPSPTRSSERPEAASSTTSEPEPSPTRSSERPEAASPITSEPEPSPTQSSERVETAPPTEAPTSAASPETSASVEPSAAESSGAPSWLWWLLAAVVLAVVVAVPLVVRARRRGAWRADLASAEDEMAWFARVLVAELRQMGSLAEAAGGWNVAASRVTAVEDRLTALEASAPDEAARTRTRALRDAVRSARGHMQELLESGSPDTMSRDLDAIAAELEAALASVNPLA